ncbi:MAG: DUF6737 family protein [Leptolyngbyaceae cyanobacterium bins.302]|nr:DUF6737 family protein [Leptolyngbyaceae cyanobacterium bins.302]
MPNETDKQPLSVWDYKPWWCQPWSILLTGISIGVGSWVMFHQRWLTGLAIMLVLVWMSYFLLVYPKLFRQMYENNELSTSPDRPPSI